MKRTVIVLLWIIISIYNSVAQEKKCQIHSDLPGGNIIIGKMSNDTIWLKPDLRDTKGNWFYWYFKITGISGRTIYFQFTKQDVFTKYGPAYSINNDNNWKWYGENSYAHNGFKYTFSKKDTCAYFSMAFPYTQKNLYTFLNNLRNKDLLKIDTLCFTKNNRAVEEIYILPSHDPQYRVLITSRHHACEMAANYVIEGITQSITNETDLQFLRDYVEFRIIPFVDKDGVEDGDQGKNRKPRDHNRDYGDNSIYQSVKAIKSTIPGWSEGILKIALDIHCPWIKGGNSENIYLVGSENKVNEQQQILFSDLLEKNCTGELNFYRKYFMCFGKAWNTNKNYHEGISFKRWATTIEGIALSTSMEFPYANVSGAPVTKDGARAFGKAIAYSMMDYLKLLDE
ncbi:MAG: peptidase M14 [Bacteroidetes bacterium]|nr:peptidase M14 [Bacteroidota bacterium]